jgi:low affinity Fe/Cu permease
MKGGSTAMMSRIGHALTRLGEWAAHPAAFGLVVLYVAAWLIFDAKSFGWTAVTEIVVLVMTLFIVRAEFRDTQAIHAKLDKILEAQGQASEEITSLDEREPEEIVQQRHEGSRRGSESRRSRHLETQDRSGRPGGNHQRAER